MSWQVAVAGGVVAGTGVVTAVSGFFPSQRPDPIAVLHRLDPARPSAAQIRRAGPVARPHPLTRVLGRPLIEAAAGTALLRPPSADLALLGMTVEGYTAMRLASGLVGLALPPLLSALAVVLRLHVPWAAPVGASLAVGLLLFVSSGQDVHRRARAARREFRHVLQRYMELVALERAANIGAIQALEAAAQACDSWVTARISDVLLAGSMGNLPPWDRLKATADEIGVPELAELAQIMQTGGEEGAAIYSQLLARSSALRDEIATDEHAEAEERSERMIVPMTLLAVLFIVLIAYPLAVRIK